jgi:hypothetical protein
MAETAGPSINEKLTLQGAFKKLLWAGIMFLRAATAPSNKP